MKKFRELRNLQKMVHGEELTELLQVSVFISLRLKLDFKDGIWESLNADSTISLTQFLHHMNRFVQREPDFV
jgi:hypothetical protein